MMWWAWIVAGAILLGAELFFVDAQFYLVFVGAAAIAVGIVDTALPELPVWAQWAGFAALAAVSMVGFRRRVYERIKGHAPGYVAAPVGTQLDLAQALAPGESCQVEHGGSYWTATNDSGAAIAKGTRVRVVAVEGLTLRVRADA
jgi:inner membrane protein